MFNGWIRGLVKLCTELLPVLRDGVARGSRFAEPTKRVPCDHVLLVMAGRHSQLRGRHGAPIRVAGRFPEGRRVRVLARAGHGAWSARLPP